MGISGVPSDNLEQYDHSLTFRCSDCDMHHHVEDKAEETEEKGDFCTDCR